jgi:hypothetical protein
VRLREVQGASDVKLDHATKPDETASAGSSSSDTSGCGKTHGSSNYDFKAIVTLESPKTAPEVHGVPASLGGGQ